MIRKSLCPDGENKFKKTKKKNIINPPVESVIVHIKLDYYCGDFVEWLVWWSEGEKPLYCFWGFFSRFLDEAITAKHKPNDRVNHITSVL